MSIDKINSKHILVEIQTEESLNKSGNIYIPENLDSTKFFPNIGKVKLIGSDIDPLLKVDDIVLLEKNAGINVDNNLIVSGDNNLIVSEDNILLIINKESE